MDVQKLDEFVRLSRAKWEMEAKLLNIKLQVQTIEQQLQELKFNLLPSEDNEYIRKINTYDVVIDALTRQTSG